MNWSDFKQRYHQELSHVAGFEERFVDTVLAQIPGLSPQDVIPQYRFTDNKGGNRYVDFMIINKANNWLLPIELDGYAKMVGNGEEYHRFNDFLVRQNAMIQRFGLVLRYTNKTMLNQPQTIINEIRQTLQKQSQAKSTQDIQAAHTQAIIADYEAKLKRLQTKQAKQGSSNHNSDKSNNQLLATLNELKQEIHALKTTVPNNPPQAKTKSTWWMWVIGFVLGFVLVGIALVLTTKKAEDIPTAPDDLSISTDIEMLPPEPEAVPEPEAKPTITTTSQDICGTVVQAKAFKGGTYLNLDKPYPNQTMTFKVWKQTNLDDYVGKYVCSYGEVNYYKGKPYINVNNLKAIKMQ